MRQSKGNHRRISSAQRPWASGQLLLLALFVAAVLAGSLTLLALHSSRGRQHTLHGDGVAPSLEELYGSLNSSSSSSGPHQILLLSYFSSGASLLARLLMLMGVFAGDGEQLRIGEGGAASRCSCAGCNCCVVSGVAQEFTTQNGALYTSCVGLGPAPAALCLPGAALCTCSSSQPVIICSMKPLCAQHHLLLWFAAADATNRLRWWELKQVTTLNEL
jgi:hypothetical protein